jgi:uncharacterized membrane protein
MTEPIKLLEKRLQEIRSIKEDASKVSKKDDIKINHLFNQYYACIRVLKNFEKTMIKDHLYTINVYEEKEGEIISTKHTFDLQQARRWKEEADYAEIINQIGNEIK